MNQVLSRRRVLGTMACLAAPALPVRAQMAWPSKLLKFIVPYPAGGTPDAFTRQLAEQVARRLGVSAVVENRPGASGLLGMRAVSQAQADQHSFAYVSSGQVTLSAMNPKFDLLRELKPVARLTGSAFVALVSADSPYRTMGELIAAVQARPGKLSFGTAGPGSPAHMALEYLEEATRNFKALHVPFKGAVESINAILGGQIDFTIGVLGAAMPQIKAGKLRALGVTTARRVPQLPSVPTIAEASGTSYAYQSWGGFMMHANTPDAVLERAAAAFGSALQSETVKHYMQAVGSFADRSESPAAFGEQLRREIALEKQIVKRLGIVQE